MDKEVKEEINSILCGINKKYPNDKESRNTLKAEFGDTMLIIVDNEDMEDIPMKILKKFRKLHNV
ncbi:MAG: hypothetical protein ACOC5T_08160 [Elusimicrobiota bacterium]